MKFLKSLSLIFFAAAASLSAQAKPQVLTTTTDLAAIVREVGKDLVEVDSIAKGTQDPHFIEAKPSFMVKASQADLLVAIGLDLEVGWLPSIVRGARNPKIVGTGKGYLEVGSLVAPIEVPSGTVTRADGDVHPRGNPHITLDPIRVGEIAEALARRLGEIDATNDAVYRANAADFRKRLVAATEKWKARIQKSGVKRIVTYHKTLSYFFDRFALENPAMLEPKPGIPPTSGHIIEVIGLIRTQKIPLILVENFFDPTVTKKIQVEVPNVRVATVPVSVDGAPGTTTLFALYESLVQAIEGGK